MANWIPTDNHRFSDPGYHPGQEVTNMPHAFECGDVIPGCAASFEADTEEKLLAEVGEHARSDHDIEEIDADTLAVVRSKIRQT